MEVIRSTKMYPYTCLIALIGICMPNKNSKTKRSASNYYALSENSMVFFKRNMTSWNLQGARSETGCALNSPWEEGACRP